MVIPESVRIIWEEAFSNCISLTKVVIPSSVTTMFSFAFNECTALTIYCEVEDKPSGWEDNWNYSNVPVVWGYSE